MTGRGVTTVAALFWSLPNALVWKEEGREEGKKEDWHKLAGYGPRSGSVVKHHVLCTTGLGGVMHLDGLTRFEVRAGEIT